MPTYSFDSNLNFKTLGDGGPYTDNWHVLNSANCLNLDANILYAGNLAIKSSTTTANAPMTHPFVYQEISGDFDIDTKVIQVNAGAFQGLMCRDPNASAGEDFIDIGWDSSTNLWWGDLTNDVSTSGNLSSTNTYVRLARVGNTFTAYRKLNSGDSWTSVKVFTRDTFAGHVLQVGLFQQRTAATATLRMDYYQGTWATSGSAGTGAATLPLLTGYGLIQFDIITGIGILPALIGGGTGFSLGTNNNVLPLITATGTGTSPNEGEAAITLPLIEASGVSENGTTSVSLVLPAITATAQGSPANAGVASAQLPLLRASGTDQVNTADLILPLLQAYGVSLQEVIGTADVYLYKIVASGTGLQEGLGTADITFPLLIAIGTGDTLPYGTGEVTLPLIVGSGVSYDQAGIGEAILPMLIATSADTFIFGTGAITLPKIVSAGTSPNEGSAAITLPSLFFGYYNQGLQQNDNSGTTIAIATGDAILPFLFAMATGTVDYSTIINKTNSITVAVNVKTGAVSLFTQHYNSYAYFRGKYYGGNKDGLFQITGQKDNGQSYAKSFKTGDMNVGNGLISTIRDIYITSLTSGGALNVKTVVKDTNTEVQYTLPESLMYNHRRKVPCSLGARGYNHCIEVNSDADNIEVFELGLNQVPSKRRIGR